MTAAESWNQSKGPFVALLSDPAELKRSSRTGEPGERAVVAMTSWH